jgi:hypothetical protein
VPYEIEVLECKQEHIRGLRDFYCGSDPWAVDAAHWIKTRNIATERKRGASIWLFGTEELGIVGYGSYSSTQIFNRESPKPLVITLGHIPYIAVRNEFQGKPDGVSKEDRFASLILRHILSEAVADYLKNAADKTRRPELHGLVDVSNNKALTFFRRWNFEITGQTTTPDDKTYHRIILSLRRFLPDNAPTL